jgi:hypothetical protein
VGGAETSTTTTVTVGDVPPTATTQSADAVTTTTAVLHATVDPHGGSATARFQYGARPDLTGAAVTAAQPVATGLGAVPMSAPLSGLAPGVRYYFRVVATDLATGTPVYGSIGTFSTPEPPPRAASTMTWSFAREHRSVLVKSLVVKQIPEGAAVQTLTCIKARCRAFTTRPRRTVKRQCRAGHCRSVVKTSQSVDLSSHFRNQHLPTSAQITVRIAKPGWIGKVYVFSMKTPGSPHIACLAPGGTRPGIGC